jgi:RNA-binding protein YhbY
MTTKTKISHMQLGKNGLTEGFLSTLKSHFDNHLSVKISVLKNATRDRGELKEIADKIKLHLGDKFTTKIIGYTIIVKKWRKPQVDLKNTTK